ncbi:MAG: MFS transporter [Sphingomonas sp.]
MAATRLKIALMLSYAVFAVLLNSVGTVILQSIETFGVDKVTASTLEGFKDLPIAITSFLVASQLYRLGLRRGMMAGLALAGLACLAMPIVPSFWTTRLLFLAIGVSFAITKVAVYSLVGLLTEGEDGHAGLLNLVEGVFMLGVLSGYWLFGAFIDAAHPGNPAWLHVYYVLAAACFVAILLLASARFDESRVQRGAQRGFAEDFAEMLALVGRRDILIFVAAIFLYVLVEQGVGSWLPTFNREILKLSAPMSVQAASIFAVSLAAGRLGAGVVVRRTGAFRLLIGCLIGMAALILLALPLAAGHVDAVADWRHAPAATFVFPLIGLVMAPIYPALNSSILSGLDKAKQPPMVGLIVVFSALGGTSGSLIVGRTFAAMGGTTAFYLLLAPIALLLVAVRAMHRAARHAQHAPADSHNPPAPAQ